MPDYGLIKDELVIIPAGTAGGDDKPGLFLFRSGSLRNPNTAVSASLPNKIAITCSANTNNVLTKLTNTNAYAIITIANGEGGIGEAIIGEGFVVGRFINKKIKDTRLVLRYVSSSFTPLNRSITSSKFHNDTFIDIPIQNNDDSFSVAYKTVNALNKKGNRLLYTASFVDDRNTLSNVSSSLGTNMAIGTTFKIRSGSLLSGSVDVGGKFIITSLNSGSVLEPDFSGTKVQINEMKVGNSFKIGGSDPLFNFNIIQSGSGRKNQPQTKGNFIFSSQSLSIELDPNDKTSALISGSGDAKLYFSSSGRIGVGTTDPKSALDISGDLTLSDNLIVEGTITANAYIVTQSITTVTSGSTIFGNSADDSHLFTGSITSSGNISSSGDVIARSGSFDVISKAGDPDTRIYFSDDDINIMVGGINMVDFTEAGSDEITFNEQAADLDVRIEGEDDANLLFTDASTPGRVGIGTNEPSKKLTVEGDISASGNIHGLIHGGFF